MRKSKSNPPRYRIAQYWDKQNLIETSNGQSWNPMIDVGEPSCQACGCYNGEWDTGEFEENNQKHNNLILKQRWDNSGLERCHIIADEFGGSNSVENLLLLCRQCHVAFDFEVYISDNKDIQKVYDWLQNRRKQKQDIVMKIINMYIEDYGMDKNKFTEYFMQCWMNIPTGKEKMLEVHVARICDNAKMLYDIQENRPKVFG